MEVFFFLLLMVGAVVLKLPELKDLIRLAGLRFHQWKEGFVNEEEWARYGKERFYRRIPEHVRRVLQLSLSLGTRKSVRAFFLLSGALGSSVLVLVAQRTSLPAAGAAGLMACMMPYLGLRCILQGRQVSGSHEGEILVTEILNNYKINFYNMTQAIEVTAMTLEEAPYSRKLLFNLSRGLNRVSDNTELKALMEEFHCAMGTAWAGILAVNMYLACQSGVKVTESLSDLALSMERARQIEEFSRRENNETRAILRYLVPFGSLLMTAGGIHFFGLSAGEWFYYQFQTPSGIAWFVLWLLTYMTAVGVHLLLSNRKFDL